MKTGQTLQSHQTPIASDSETASAFMFGLENTIEQSKQAVPEDVPHKDIGKGSMPRKGVWGNGFCKP